MRLNNFTIILFFIGIISCTQENQNREKFVAEVGRSKLLSAQVDSALGSLKIHSRYKNEYIRKWIETELLAQVADEMNILDSTNYHFIINESKRELAASFAIQKYLATNPIKFTEADLLDYFNKNRDDFLYKSTAYYVNIAGFSNEEAAIEFRNLAVNKGWQSAQTYFEKRQELLYLTKEKLIKQSEVNSNILLRILDELYSQEISIVVNTEPNKFIVVQTLDKIDPETVPKFDYLKSLVESRYEILQKKIRINEYIEKLYSEKQVTIFEESK